MDDVFDTSRPRGLLALLIRLFGGHVNTAKTAAETAPQTVDTETPA